MAVNYSTIAEKIMRYIQGNGLSLKMFDSENGKSVSNPDDARFFYIDEPNMMVSIDESSKEVKLHFGEGVDIDKPKAEKIMNSLKNLSREYMLDFDVRSFGKHIEPKNYAYKLDKNKEQTMSDVFNEGMSKLEGSSRTSRQTLENVRLIVKHRAPVNEEQRGARSRNISSIFVENAEGERFKYPFKHLNGARAMARHVAHGGVPSDMVGESIIELSSNLSKLKEFMNVVNRQSLVNENNRSVVLNVKRRMESIKESIKRIQGAKGYQAFVEKLAINETEENKSNEITEDTVDNYVKKFTKTTFEESLRDVLPLIHRVNEEEMEDNRLNQIQSVMSIITSKDKKTGEKMNRIYFPKRTDGFDFDKIKKQYREPTSKEEAEEQKKMKLALQVDDLAHRVDVDAKDDKKRKNKGHDRAAELSNFLGDVADDIRNGTNLSKDKLKLAGYLMKLSKTATEGEQVVKQNIEEQFDSMLAEAFDKFEIPA
tara:strand:+ start:565 stop:2013 length:1449 start_codon:yes stop_codon:yes gene_type:complete